MWQVVICFIAVVIGSIILRLPAEIVEARYIYLSLRSEPEYDGYLLVEAIVRILFGLVAAPIVFGIAVALRRPDVFLLPDTPEDLDIEVQEILDAYKESKNA